MTVGTRLAPEERQDQTVGHRHAGADKGGVEIAITDTGIGMDEDTRRRCIEPFFTTKGERGTGLGLAMVYGAMRRHQAQIAIESVPGQGTCSPTRNRLRTRHCRRRCAS
jgi:signal transduction histidine kinase